MPDGLMEEAATRIKTVIKGTAIIPTAAQADADLSMVKTFREIRIYDRFVRF